MNNKKQKLEEIDVEDKDPPMQYEPERKTGEGSDKREGQPKHGGGTNPRRFLKGGKQPPLPPPPPDIISGDIEQLIQERQRSNWNWKTLSRLTVSEALERCDTSTGCYRLSMETKPERERVFHILRTSDWEETRGILVDRGFFSKIYGEGVCAIDVLGMGEDDVEGHDKWAISNVQIASPSGDVLVIRVEADCRNAPPHYSYSECAQHIAINGCNVPKEISQILECVELFKVQSHIKGVGDDVADVERLENIGVQVRAWVEAENLALLFSPQPEIEDVERLEVDGEFILGQLDEQEEVIKTIGAAWKKGNAMKLGEQHFDTWPLRIQTYTTSRVLSWFAYMYKNVARLMRLQRFGLQANVLPFIHDVLFTLVGTLSWKRFYTENKLLVRKFGTEYRQEAFPWLPRDGFGDDEAGHLQVGDVKVITIRELARRKTFLGFRFVPRPEDFPASLEPPKNSQVLTNRIGYAANRWMTPPKLEKDRRMKEMETALRPILIGLCNTCGAKYHHMKNCKVEKEYLKCEYPLCSKENQEANPHNTEVCGVLHGLCKDCLWRGHEAVHHYKYSLCSLEAIFFCFQPLGWYTSWPLVPTTGHHPNSPNESAMKWGMTRRSGITAASRRHNFEVTALEAEEINEKVA